MQDLLAPQDDIQGDISIGAAETTAVTTVISAVKTMQKTNPRTRFHFFSGNALEITKKLEEDSLDFGVVFEPTVTQQYHFLKLNHRDTWGVLMLKTSPLAAKEAISPQDLWKLPLIVSIQTVEQQDLASWMYRDFSELNIVATYNLLYNASLMVREGLGYALCLYNLFDFSDNSPLCFRPLSPAVPISLQIIWKKHRPLSNAAQYFLEVLTRQVAQMPETLSRSTDGV